MAMKSEEMMQALYDTIYNSITGATGGVPTVTSPVFVMARPGLAVQPKDFTNALSTTNPNGLMSTLQAFSDLVDPAPLYNAAYTPGPIFTATYGQLVKGQCDPMEVSQAQQDAYDAAKELVLDEHDAETIAVANYRAASAAYDAAIQNYNALYWETDQSTGKGQRAFQAKSPPLKSAIQTANSNLAATSPGKIESALATMAQFDASSGTIALSQASADFDLAAMQDVVGGGQFWPALAYPTDWMDPTSESAYAAVTISSKSLKLDKSSSYNAYSAGGSASWGLWSVEAESSGEFKHEDMNEDTSDIEVAFKFARVTIARPWLRSGLFSLRGLTVGNIDAGGYSTGQANILNIGVSPLLVTSMIVAKDMQISGAWGHEDSEFISSSISAKASVGWGPFKVSGSYTHSSSSESMTSTFDGTTLTLPGMSILGYVCTLVPFSPAEAG